MTKPHIILASQSIGRKQILTHLGIPFTTIPSSYEEDMTLKLAPDQLAITLATGKAEDVAQHHPNSIIIAGDTFVIGEKELFGKAHTQADAKRMLDLLNGTWHSIVTGYCVIYQPLKIHISGSVTTRVKLASMSEKEIADYIATNEPLNKAGAYTVSGIGSIFIEKIEGDYWSVIGLPIRPIALALRECGVDVIKNKNEN